MINFLRLIPLADDTANVPIPDADVVVTRGGDGAAVKAAKSNKRGLVTLRDLPAGGPYTVSVTMSALLAISTLQR